MKTMIRTFLTASMLLFLNSSAVADDLEGQIESVDPNSQSLVVQGITFYTTESTDYDDDLQSFADLRPGQKVEIDFRYHDGKHYATEIELDH